MLIIYHNPRCSKSRNALEIAQQFAEHNQLDLEIIDYQKSPLNLSQLTELHQILQSEQVISILDMVRDTEDSFATLALKNASDSDLLKALAAHPQLLQRPIIRFDKRAVIARPPELVNAILHVF